eukprot:2261825-Amphidinium_carterae.1
MQIRILPTSQQVLARDWERHHQQGLLTKLLTCTTCRKESGPWIIHKRTAASERNIGVLHADIAHLWDQALTKMFGFLSLSKASPEVTACVQETILWIRNSASCSSMGFGRSLKRFMSDNGGDFNALDFQGAVQHLGLHLNLSPCYERQSNGMAERCVGLMKRRLLISTNLSVRYWPYADNA